MVLQRSGVISYLRELLEEDFSISPESILIEQTKDSKVVKLIIKIKDGQREAIRAVAKKNGLTVKEESENITIFEPKMPQCSLSSVKTVLQLSQV